MIDWPATITRGALLVGPYIGTGGQYETARVWVSPVFPDGLTHLVHAGTGVVLTPFKEAAGPDADMVQVELPLCDDPQWTTPTGDPAPAWEYRVQVEVTSTSTHDRWVLDQKIAPTVAAPLVRLSGSSAGSTLPTTPGPVSVTETAPGVYVITGTQAREVAPGQVTFTTTEEGDTA